MIELFKNKKEDSYP